MFFGNFQKLWGALGRERGATEKNFCGYIISEWWGIEWYINFENRRGGVKGWVSYTHFSAKKFEPKTTFQGSFVSPRPKTRRPPSLMEKHGGICSIPANPCIKIEKMRTLTEINSYDTNASELAQRMSPSSLCCCPSQRIGHWKLRDRLLSI